LAPTQSPAAQPVSSTKRWRVRRPVAARESYTAELELLQRAQSQYASHDFSDALVLIAEHARRFPNGRLAEEREALRVRSLAGDGRSDETRRAFAAFAKRFPRSALLPRLQATAPAAQE
jgi:TolA-binding protein